MAELLYVVDDDVFDEHVAQAPHPERPERLIAARQGLFAAVPEPLRRPLAARPARPDELAAVHAGTHLEALERALLRGWGHLDADTYHSPATRDAAWRAAGAAAELGRQLVQTDIRRAFALVRPPGHPAEVDRAMGFCLLTNVAIAARAALAAGAERVAIVDWDVHHGNGTQDVFDDDPRVLFVSLHQWPLYPGTGAAEEIGRGEARGRTCNLALPSHSDDEAYADAFARVVLPLVRAHAPDVILVSAGFDAHARDPLGEMHLSSAAYGAMASALAREAEALGHGRVGFLLEGGYDLEALAESVEATARAAIGERVDLPPPRPTAAVDRTLAALRPHWRDDTFSIR
ncbi:MAG: histone deacetylase [Sandaracinaceae bacterium]|nr:histone deacetylase [Sandaracinaceae bacterium]